MYQNFHQNFGHIPCSAKPNLKTFVFICLCTHLSPISCFAQNIGGASVIQNEQALLYYSRLSLYLNNIGFNSA